MGLSAINIDLTDIFGSVERTIDNLTTSKQEKLELANELLKIKNETLRLQNEAKNIDAELEKVRLELDAARLKVDEAMQKSDNKYASSARPTVIYVLLGTVTVAAMLLPIAAWIAQCIEQGTVLPSPQLDIQSIVGFGFTVLGIAGMRTFEKIKGVA